MKEYLVNNDMNNKNYGIYDLLCLNDLESHNNKTLGCCNKKLCFFRIGIADHNDEFRKIEEVIGSYDFYFSTYRKNETESEINVSYIKNDYPNIFEYNCLLGILNECLKYQKEFNKIIKFSISDKFFIDGNERDTCDIERIINDLNESIRKLNEEKKSIEEPEVNIKISNIDKLMSIFKKNKNKSK